MDYKIVESRSPQSLEGKVKELLNNGWKVVGGHQVVITRSQNRYSGSQFMDTIHTSEYTQTMVKDSEDKKEILTEEMIMKAII